MAAIRSRTPAMSASCRFAQVDLLRARRELRDRRSPRRRARSSPARRRCSPRRSTRIADCANQGLLLWGMREARRSPTPDHPLGYGKAIYFWSFIVALMLFSMGGLFSIYEGVHKLQAAEPIQQRLGRDRRSSSSASPPRASRCGAACARSTRSAARSSRCGAGSAARARASCWSSSARTSPRSAAWRWRSSSSASPSAPATRVGRGRLDRHRRAAGARRGARRHRGQGAARRPERRAASARARCARTSPAQPEVESVYNLLTQQLGRDVMVAVKARMRAAAESARRWSRRSIASSSGFRAALSRRCGGCSSSPTSPTEPATARCRQSSAEQVALADPARAAAAD